MTQEVCVVQSKTEFTSRPLPNAYQLHRERGFVWLQKACLWVLKRLRCYAFVDVGEMTYIRFKPKDFLDSLIKQRGELLKFYHGRGEALLIGAEDFAELMGSKVYSPMRFQCDYHAMDNGRPRVFGMPVTVVPWMKGVLVVPESFDH